MLIDIKVDFAYCMKTKKRWISLYIHLCEYISSFLYFSPLDEFLELEILIQKILSEPVPIYILATVYKDARFSKL